LVALKAGITVKKSDFLIGTVLFFFFLTFTSVLNHLIKHAGSSTGSFHFIQALHYFAIASTLIIGSLVFSRISKSGIARVSLAAISIQGVVLFVVSSDILKLAIIFSMTVLFSLVLLALFSWFWRITELQERGRATGLMGFVALPFCFLTGEVVVASLDFNSTALLSVILASGVLVLFSLSPGRSLTRQKSTPPNYWEGRTVFLYSVPWVVFSLVNATLASNVSLSISAQVSPSFYFLLLASQIAGVCVGAVVGGVVADFFGRRHSLALSLTLYGIGSAFVGLLQDNVIFLVAYAVNGLSWGILFVLYIFVVWGDLATEKNVERMYSVGLVVFYSILGVGVFSPQISQAPLITTALASCLLIFFLNVPVLLAPELLPSDIREKARLALHIKAVKKIRRKPKG
jgi:hypothetical protein